MIGSTLYKRDADEEGLTMTDDGTETTPEPPIISMGSVWTSGIWLGSSYGVLEVEDPPRCRFYLLSSSSSSFLIVEAGNIN